MKITQTIISALAFLNAVDALPIESKDIAVVAQEDVSAEIVPDLEKRRGGSGGGHGGGGHGGGGSSGSSSGGSSSGGSSSGSSGSSGSSSGGRGGSSSGSSGSSGSSSGSSSGGRGGGSSSGGRGGGSSGGSTSSSQRGSGITSSRPGSNGRYAGGTATPFIAGLAAASGLAATALLISHLTPHYPGYWGPHGTNNVYQYQYNETFNGTNYDVSCYCIQKEPCSCDKAPNQQYFIDLPQNISRTQVDGNTTFVYINGTLPAEKKTTTSSNAASGLDANTAFVIALSAGVYLLC